MLNNSLPLSESEDRTLKFVFILKVIYTCIFKKKNLTIFADVIK